MGRWVRMMRRQEGWVNFREAEMGFYCSYLKLKTIHQQCGTAEPKNNEMKK